LRPNTIRAKFGIDRVKNAVHCTDLSEDGILEVKTINNNHTYRSNIFSTSSNKNDIIIVRIFHDKNY